MGEPDAFLSRVSLRAGDDHARLGPVLFPDGDARSGVSHRLVWSLFPTSQDKRDFLYREVRDGHHRGPGQYLVLSGTRPEDRLGLFQIDTIPFTPSLRQGDRLRFSLRANAMVTKGGQASTKTRGKRHDVVMDAIHALPRGSRAEARREAIRVAGTAWLQEHGSRSGFTIVRPETDLQVDGYAKQRVENRTPRAKGRRHDDITFSSVEYDGLLQVTDPTLLVQAIRKGLGGERSFGCGLMLVSKS